MHSLKLLILNVILGMMFINWITIDNQWIIEYNKGYRILYKEIDKNNVEEYKKLFDHGITLVKEFFDSSYIRTFDIVVHPNRLSLDSAWQKDWNMPEFKSECWMVASGIALKLDIISPQTWDTEACEHKYTETKETQQIVTHELVHVYHGQRNASPDFSNVEGIDWFVEGLATYASGQCDSLRISEIRKAILENKIPESLDYFWTGRLKYGLSGSVVMFIDKKYGRVMLNKLLPLNKKSDLFSTLNTTESELLDGWKKYIQQF